MLKIEQVTKIDSFFYDPISLELVTDPVLITDKFGTDKLQTRVHSKSALERLFATQAEDHESFSKMEAELPKIEKELGEIVSEIIFIASQTAEVVNHPASNALLIRVTPLIWAQRIEAGVPEILLVRMTLKTDIGDYIPLIDSDLGLLAKHDPELDAKYQAIMKKCSDNRREAGLIGQRQRFNGTYLTKKLGEVSDPLNPKIILKKQMQQRDGNILMSIVYASAYQCTSALDNASDRKKLKREEKDAIDRLAAYYGFDKVSMAKVSDEKHKGEHNSIKARWEKLTADQILLNKFLKNPLDASLNLLPQDIQLLKELGVGAVVPSNSAAAAAGAGAQAKENHDKPKTVTQAAGNNAAAAAGAGAGAQPAAPAGGVAPAAAVLFQASATQEAAASAAAAAAAQAALASRSRRR